MSRLDIYLKDQLGSRARAQDAIKEGRVFVNGIKISKASYQIDSSDRIEIIKKDEDFVSRAGYKLQAAFDAFDIDIKNQVVIDIGASTGGFSQVCLNHHAKKVYAIDVGHLQLSELLKNDKRIIMMEGYNARNIHANDFDDEIDFVCMDVSFISSRTILDVLFKNLQFQHLAFLIKPQFECGPEALNKHGVITNEKLVQQIVIDMERYCMRYFRKVRTLKSPIKGRQGNQEYMLYAREPR